MSTSNNLTTMNGLFKKVYADSIENLIPEGYKLIQLIKFAGKDKRPGEDFNQPVVLGQEHGISYAGSDEGAFNLNPPISMQIKRASVSGYQMLLRSAMAYDAAFAAEGKGERAFEDASKYLVMNMMESMQKKLEIRLFYGQSGLASVASVAANVVTVTTADWAPGIWSGAESMRIEFYDSTGATLRGDAKVTSVDFDNLTITVDAMPAGVTATDIIYEYGSFGKEFPGLYKIITNTGSLFGISATSYAMWKGNSYAVGGNLTFEKLAQGLARPVEKGLNKDVSVIVNPRTWAKLMTEQAGTRRYDVSYRPKNGEQGFEALVFHSQNGKMEIMSSNYVKQGHAFAISADDFARIGSTDVTFKLHGDEFFHQLENNAGYGIRCYTNQSLFCKAPCRQLIFTGITN